MGAAARSKGRRGQSDARKILASRDWNVSELNAGTSVEDFIAVDPDGKSWSIEIKNTKAITTAHRDQAMAQAGKRKLPWMLMSHIAGTSSWLVQRRGCKPVVWSDLADEGEQAI